MIENREDAVAEDAQRNNFPRVQLQMAASAKLGAMQETARIMQVNPNGLA